METPIPPLKEPFIGQMMNFADGSRWLLQEALSQIALQQNVSPCEARQVFTAVCVDDPLGRYRDIGEAVIKIKFQ